VGDSADGFPGIPGLGPKTAARLIARHGSIEDFPDDVLGAKRDLALLFKTLATLRVDAPLFDDVDALRWCGSLPSFKDVTARIGDARLLARVAELERRVA